MAITPLPDPPTRTDRTNFRAKADAFVAALPDFGTEANALATEVNGYATDAESAKDDAESAESVALAAANFAGSWAVLTGAVTVPTSVSHDGAFWMLINNLADVTTSEPGVTADWEAIVHVPTTHASTHATGESDAIAPADIGAAAASHTTPAATTSAAGHVELATDAEAIDHTVDNKVLTPSNLYHAFNNRYDLVSDVYGLRWTPSTSSFTRLYEAVGLSGGSDFNSLEPWASMRRCNLSDAGEVLAYHGDVDFSYTGSNGQVMVEVPKFFYRTEATATTKTFIVSPTQYAGMKVHPAFVRDGVEINHIYVSAFEGFYNTTDGTIDSIANVVPSTNDGVSDGALSPIAAYPDGSIVGCRGYAQARGTGWELCDFLTHNALCYLMFVEYGTFDSQTAIGMGVVDKASGSNNNANLTGHTAGYDSGSDLGNGTGYTGTNGLVSVSYRGVENLWGNVWKWIDGLNINDNVPWIADHGFTSDKFEPPYYSLNVTLPASNNYGGDIVVNDYFDAGFLISALGGADNSGLYDYYYQSTGMRVALPGGYWAAASGAGALYWNLSASSALDARFIGARSLYIPSM